MADRRGWMIVLTAAMLLVAAPSPAQEPPNVVLIISDDQAWTDFGFMGHPVVDTPHLDRLAAEGAVFSNAYVPTSLCRPSLATFATGLYPSQHRIANNDPPEGSEGRVMQRFIEEVPTLPRLLQESGYRSLQTGKWWEGHYRNAGFTHGMTTEGRSGGPGRDIGRKTMRPIYDFIEKSGDRPFFIWYAPLLPHRPHNPPDEYLRTYAAGGRDEALARYYAMCEWLDATVGELMAYLETHAENTLVLFAADNGWEPPNEHSPKTGHASRYSPRSKLSPYDLGLRTPVILWWPGRVEPGWHREPVSTVDLAPTILKAAGIEPPALMPGRDLREVASGQSLPEGAHPERAHGEAVFGEMFTHDAVDIERPDLSATHQWVRQGDWKLILPVDSSDDLELYHLAPDPFETVDLASKRPEKVRALRALLERWPYRSTAPGAAQGSQ